MIEEIFKDVKGYEELYQVSNFGRVKSLGNGNSNNSKERILKPSKNSKGYFQVHLSKNGKSKMCKIHRLVAQTFIPNPNNLTEINHIDEDKTNNRVENLEYCTHEYNCNYGTRIERIVKKQTNGKRSKIVLQFTLSGEFIREWPSTMECERNGYYHGNVGACCRGEKPYYKGYIWKYK